MRSVEIKNAKQRRTGAVVIGFWFLMMAVVGFWNRDSMTSAGPLSLVLLGTLGASFGINWVVGYFENEAIAIAREEALREGYVEGHIRGYFQAAADHGITIDNPVPAPKDMDVKKLLVRND